MGHQVAGLSMLGLALQLMTQSLALLGPSSEAGQDALDAIKKLSKHIPPGSVTDADKKNMMQKMMHQQIQQAPQLAALRAQQAPPQAA